MYSHFKFEPLLGCTWAVLEPHLGCTLAALGLHSGHTCKLLYNNAKTLFGKTYITYIFIYLNLIVAAPEIRAALTQL